MSTPTENNATRASAGADSAPVMRIRRPKVADPLVRPKKRPPPKLVTRPATEAPTNGAIPARPPQNMPSVPKVLPGSQSGRVKSSVRDDVTVNGFSGPMLSPNYVDYPLVTTKRAWREGLKHYVAKFASKKTIDPRDDFQFTRPVRLQRRDPRVKPHEPDSIKTEDASKPLSEGGHGLDDTEREGLEAKKAAREKEREENLAQIAPSVATNQKRSNAPKQKTQYVHKADMTSEEIAKARIKYEEALPWHLEDFDGKNTWVGNYEAALSETYAMFVLEDTGKMRMVPVDKWYRFNAKNPFKTLTIEEAERFMAKKIKDPRWFMEKQQEMVQQKELEAYAKQRKVYRGKAAAPTVGGGLEGDEMDFEEDRFADDEEVDNGLFEEDEEAKAAEKRIKQDQLKANVFNLKEEKDYDEEEVRERKEREARKIQGKKVRKALQKREKNYDYSSGSDVNPYSDEESSNDSEAERIKEEERKAEEEKTLKEKGRDSGTSTKGASTPSGRLKHVDPLKKASGLAARKRAGSPNLSDASGTDSSRKKPKHTPSQLTPQPSSRPMSPSPSSTLPLGKKRNRTGAGGSGSDVDGGAASGGDMSDGGKTKKLKLNLPLVSSRKSTPQGSRSGSPAPPPSSTLEGAPSTKGPTRVSTPRPGVQQTFPTPAEIHAAIPPSGILSRDLLKIFHPRIGDSKENHRRFIAIVKDVGVYGKEDRLLRPGLLRET